MSTYKNCDIYLTTKHHKQKVIAPIFASELIANIITCELDTDVFGTFSGEIPRTLNAIEAARKKCLWGLETTNSYLGLSSEGSFGPHPVMNFLPCNHEILYFIDRKLDFHLYEIITSAKTNYQMKVIKSIDELMDFAMCAQYPSHGLIIRPNIIKKDPILYKGLTTNSLLIEAFENCITHSSDRQVWVETDMRAHMNPSRMSVISELSIKLAKRLKELCKSCGTPGWGVTRVERGLECEQCGFATEVIKYEIFTCAKCTAEEKSLRTDVLRHADPGNCGNCNP